jgi:hypothetical protein
MKKQFVQRLMLLAVVAMASITSFAQTGEATSLKPLGDVPISDYYMVRYHVTNANSSPGQIEFIGFASNVNSDETQMTEDFDGTLTIFNYISGSVSAWVSNIPANAFTSTTLNNDSPNKSNFAACAALTTKLCIEYDEEHALTPATIGSNAFGGLTALTEVQNQTPGNLIAEIPTDAFATSVYKTAKLKVPAGSLAKYASTEGWNKFYMISDGSVTLGELEIDGDIDALDVKELKKMILSGTYSVAADLNGDGDIDALDLKKMKQIILGTY